MSSPRNGMSNRLLMPPPPPNGPARPFGPWPRIVVPERPEALGGTVPRMGEPGWEVIVPPGDADALVAASPLLAGLAPAEGAAVGDLVTWVRLPGGADLFGEGEVADAAYVLVRGRVDVHVEGALLAQHGPGEVIGEAGLLGSGVRSATVTAVRDSVLVRLEPERFERLAATHPGAARHLAAVVAERLAVRPSSRLGLRSPRVVVLSAPDGGVDPDELAHRIARSVRGRTTSVVSAAEAEAWEPPERAVRLAEREDRADLVLLVDPGHRCGTDGEAAAVDEMGFVRQADLVLLAVPAARSAPRTVRLVRSIPRSVEVLVVRRSGQLPDGRRWGTPAGAAVTITHLEWDRAESLERLARRLTGQAVGLVLGGGGARGFAHVGVVRALREAGVPIDRVGGSSMGAIIGAQVAMGMGPDELLDVNLQWSRRMLAEPAVPTVSLARGERAARLIRSFFAGRHIEDLELEFFCTTADLTTFRLHVADRGPVGNWVSASAAVPGLWPPFADVEGHLHADGGVLDNVPTAVMRSRAVGRVVAVDVCARQAAMRVEPVLPAASPAPLRVPLRKVVGRRGRATREPGLLDLMNRANLLASLQAWEQARDHADVYLTPDTAPHGFGSFDRVAELAELGYRSAVEQLERCETGSLGGSTVPEHGRG